MRLITNIELSRHTEGELAALFRQASEALARSERDSPERAMPWRPWRVSAWPARAG